MTIFDAMRTAISGMNGQSNRLTSVSDNIANSSTTGYKKSRVEFETLLAKTAPRDYAPGGILSTFRYGISAQGTLQQTSSVTDLGISGSGFFVVNNAQGAPLLTRAGSFLPDGQGNLINAAGFSLMGIDLKSANGGGAVGFASLTKVNVSKDTLPPVPSTTGNIAGNLPSQATVVAAAQLPSANAADAKYSAKTSMVAYDNLGAPVTLDVYFSKTGSNTWEATVFNRSDASATGGFPYSSGPMESQKLTFSATDGSLTGGGPLNVAIPGGSPVSINVSKTTQLGSAFGLTDQTFNGSAPSSMDHIDINEQGVITKVYQNGARVDAYRIPLASCASPDNLTVQNGNVFAQSASSGALTLDGPGLGSVNSGALESSTADLGAEMTTMIEAQRDFSANSKVFKTGSDMTDILISLKV